jgi:type II secretory pathway pseudopilin PulG
MLGQGILKLTMRRRLLAWRRTSHLPIQQMAPSSGFSLVELVIVAGLTAVVLAGLGAITLVSDVQLGRRSNSNSIQEAQERWGRAVTFIQNEAADAASLSTTPSTGGVCDSIKTNPVLVLNGPPTTPARTVTYGVRAPTTNEVGLYRGPNLLIRCGPFPGETEPQTQTVLLDGLTGQNSLQVQLLPNPGGGPDQDAQLTITMKAGTKKDGTDITFAENQPFLVHAQRSP